MTTDLIDRAQRVAETCEAQHFNYTAAAMRSIIEDLSRDLDCPAFRDTPLPAAIQPR